jgi:hypothetical protein
MKTLNNCKKTISGTLFTELVAAFRKPHVTHVTQTLVP